MRPIRSGLFLIYIGVQRECPPMPEKPPPRISARPRLFLYGNVSPMAIPSILPCFSCYRIFSLFSELEGNRQKDILLGKLGGNHYGNWQIPLPEKGVV